MAFIFDYSDEKIRYAVKTLIYKSQAGYQVTSFVILDPHLPEVKDEAADWLVYSLDVCLFIFTLLKSKVRC